MADDSFAMGYALGNDNNGSNCNNGWGADGGWLWILVIFALLGWGNGGWGGGFGGGNAGGALTRADLCQDMNFGQVQDGVRGIQQGICDSTFALNNTIVNGFNGVQRDMCTGFANINAGISENRFATQQGFNSLQAQLASCCCETQRAIDGVNYNMATNTCALQTAMATNTRDIIDSQNAGTRAILDYLCQEKISDLQSENQSLKLAASQAAQNNYLVNTLRPCPTPAYITCNPFTGTYGGYSGYGNAYNGCGCNSGCGC